MRIRSYKTYTGTVTPPQAKKILESLGVTSGNIITLEIDLTKGFFTATSVATEKETTDTEVAP